MSDPGTGGPPQPPPPGWQPPPPPAPSYTGSYAGSQPPPPGYPPPPPASGRLGTRAGDARRGAQARRDAAAAARPRRHVRRGVPHHPVQPQGHRRVGGPGRHGRLAGAGDRHRAAELHPRPLAGRDRQRQRRGARRAVRLDRVARDRPACCSLVRHDPGDRDDRPRDRRGRRRPPAHARRGLGRDPRQALAADRAGPAARPRHAAAHRRLRAALGGGRGRLGRQRAARGALGPGERPGVHLRDGRGSGCASTTCRCPR